MNKLISISYLSTLFIISLNFFNDWIGFLLYGVLFDFYTRYVITFQRIANMLFTALSCRGNISCFTVSCIKCTLLLNTTFFKEYLWYFRNMHAPVTVYCLYYIVMPQNVKAKRATCTFNLNFLTTNPPTELVNTFSNYVKFIIY